MIRCVLVKDNKYLNKKGDWGSFSKARIFYSKKEAEKRSDDFGGSVETVSVYKKNRQPQRKPQIVFVAIYVCEIMEDRVIAAGEYDAVRSEAQRFMESEAGSKLGFEYKQLPGWPGAHTAFGNKWGERVLINRMEYLK